MAVATVLPDEVALQLKMVGVNSMVVKEDGRVGSWCWWTNDCGAEDDGEDGVEGRARIGETGARDYEAIDGEED
ncbi:hypothetical protein POTOM_050135 [Populus tomentosa]|uniref:Uncharacterized protein n=1 Tax=Populus tomentosa TaxID=118781 RepID=A0A8X7YB83_POPTO|nr:hypothetical protein POTOM_050135 [Populus tomentosa]